MGGTLGDDDGATVATGTIAPHQAIVEGGVGPAEGSQVEASVGAVAGIPIIVCVDEMSGGYSGHVLVRVEAVVELAATITSTTQVSVLLSAEPLAAIDRAATHNDPGVPVAPMTAAATAHQLAAAEANAVEIITMASAVAVATAVTTADHSAAQAGATYNTTLTAISSDATTEAPTSDAPTDDAPTTDASTSDAPTSDEASLEAAGSETAGSETTGSETAKIVSKAAREAPKASEIVAEAAKVVAKAAEAFTGEGGKLR